MLMPTILVDVDNVLADTIKGFINELNFARPGIPYKAEDVKQWDFDKALELTPGTAQRIMDRSGFAYGLEPFKEALEWFPRLRLRYPTYAVTSPMVTSKTWAHERQLWLTKHFGLEPSDVIQCHAKHRVRGDVLIDDKPENINEWVKYTNGIGLLWASTNNMSFVGRSHRVHRIGTWEEAIDVIEENYQRQY